MLAAKEHQNNNGINKDTMEEHKSQKSDSKNFGLINTIVNHNNQLKKINLIVNNFPEAKQVKESIEKAKELEKTPARTTTTTPIVARVGSGYSNGTSIGHWNGESVSVWKKVDR